MALELLNKNPVLAQQDPSEAKSQCEHYLGLLYNEKGDVEAAQKHLFDAYEIADQINHVEGKAEICDTIAGLLLKLGKTRNRIGLCGKKPAGKETIGRPIWDRDHFGDDWAHSSDDGKRRKGRTGILGRFGNCT